VKVTETGVQYQNCGLKVIPKAGGSLVKVLVSEITAAVVVPDTVTVVQAVEVEEELYVEVDVQLVKLLIVLVEVVATVLLLVTLVVMVVSELLVVGSTLELLNVEASVEVLVEESPEVIEVVAFGNVVRATAIVELDDALFASARTTMPELDDSSRAKKATLSRIHVTIRLPKSVTFSTT